MVMAEPLALGCGPTSGLEPLWLLSPPGPPFMSFNAALTGGAARGAGKHPPGTTQNGNCLKQCAVAFFFYIIKCIHKNELLPTLLPQLP